MLSITEIHIEKTSQVEEGGKGYTNSQTVETRRMKRQGKLLNAKTWRDVIFQFILLPNTFCRCNSDSTFERYEEVPVAGPSFWS